MIIKEKIRMHLPPRMLLAVGQLSLVAGIFLGRFDLSFRGADFLEGMLIGISIVTNLAGLSLMRQGRSPKGDNHE